jgi:hypothetical protein
MRTYEGPETPADANRPLSDAEQETVAPCNDCGRLCYWSEDVHDYRHVDRFAVCFLIQTSVADEC